MMLMLVLMDCNISVFLPCKVIKLGVQVLQIFEYSQILYSQILTLQIKRKRKKSQAEKENFALCKSQANFTTACNCFLSLIKSLLSVPISPPACSAT